MLVIYLAYTNKKNVKIPLILAESAYFLSNRLIKGKSYLKIRRKAILMKLCTHTYCIYRKCLNQNEKYRPIKINVMVQYV